MKAPVVLRERPRLFHVRLWVIGALVSSALFRLGGSGGASRLWFLDPLLLAGFFAVVQANGRRHDSKAPLPASRSAAVFVGLSWLAAMAYELTLSAGGGASFGGLAPRTLTSFALAQGFYLPFAVFGWLLVRRYDFTLRELFFGAGAVSVFEMISTGTIASLVSSPFIFLVPVVVAYYVTVYAMFVCWPAAILGVDRFRGPDRRHLSAGRKFALMLAAGGASWLVFGAWGALLPHISSRFAVP